MVLCLALLSLTTTASTQIKVANNGKVGIGMTNPAYRLDVQGAIRFSLYGEGWENIFLDGNNQWGAPQFYSPGNQFMIGTNPYPVNGMYVNWFYYKNINNYSDEKLKENIKPLGKSLSKLLTLEGKSYNWKKDTFPNKIPDFEEMSEKKTFGFIAQDLEKAFPELVQVPNSVCEYYTINYIGLIPVLVEAIKEQQNQIEHLQAKVNESEYDMMLLMEQITACCQKSFEYSSTRNVEENNEREDVENRVPPKTSINEGSKQDIEMARLYQNTPNPFSMDTEIRFEIPESSKMAKLLVHDMQGAEIKSYTITQKGASTIIVNGFELTAGMYLYTLLVDNMIIDTKRMILTK